MNIKDLMTDDISKVDEFSAYLDEMINSRYILAEGKIIKILQTVATSTVLQQIIASALKGFDYGMAARDYNAGKIRPPFAPKEHVAFVFCILADIDSHKISLNDFLRRFFWGGDVAAWNGDINTAYASFCKALLVPFKQYVVEAISDKKKSEVCTANYENVERQAMELADAIEKYSAMLQSEKEEYIFLCDHVAAKARTDISGARALAFGLKRLAAQPNLMPYVTALLNELDY
ncbi:MAG: hypothetical protein E7350_04005 [Clostridiales bacterium]|nr:hypothetical protein [Clostridiales bacterium]